MVPVALASLLVAVGLQGLAKELSYDEAYTILCYAVPGARFSLSHYTTPNNHVVYSALLALLVRWHLEPLYRLPSLIAAAITVWLVGRSLRGTTHLSPVLRWTAVLSAFAAFPAFLSFSTQVRGYALASGLIAACVALLLPRPTGSAALRGLAYAAAGAAAVGVVPTSLLPLAALGVFDAVREVVHWRSPRRNLGGLALKHIGVLAGLLLYAPVWSNVVANSRRGWGTEGWPLAGPLLLGTVLPLGFLLVVALMFGDVRRLGGRVREIPEPTLLGLVVVTTVAAVLASGVRLFPRSFTGFIPLAVVAVVGSALHALAGRPRALLVAAVGTAVLGQAYWQVSVNLALADPVWPVSRLLLPEPYEARDFDPFEATTAASRYARAGEMVFVDNRDPYCEEMAIYYYAAIAGWQRPVIFAPQGFVKPPPRRDLAGAVVVSRDVEGRDGIALTLGLRRPRWDVVKGHGHFKVWRLAADPG